MTSTDLKDPRELLAEDLNALRQYAKRVLTLNESLPAFDEVDKGVRMREFLALGDAFKLTCKEMVGLVYKDLFTRGPRCGCPTCRARAGQGDETVM